tara:strand:+ start:515 stop:952 length:438 start_codon:yes stop_codon:yes gene_type:complete
MKSKDRPYILYVAEIIYKEISEIKKNNSDLSNIDAINSFIGSETYNVISSGEFHDNWFKELKNNKYMDEKSKKKIPEETIRLIKIQKEMMIKQLIQFPNLYYTKNNLPLKISQRAFDHLWRVCESYELWCKETNQNKFIFLNIIN